MYEEFFGLTEKPFSIQPDPSFLYWGRSHRLAYAMLEYGVLNHAGISVVTGEVGCGKTTLIHRLLDQLSETHSVALLSNIQQGRGDLLSWVLMGFGQPFAGKTHVELFSQLQGFFIGEYAKGRRTVLIIDEAQNLSVDMLEELRMLSNINAGKDQLLQLILVGQPQLKDLLNRPDMLQLAQRVGADFHLTPLSREEVDAYLDTRLTIAGARRRIFTDRAVDLIAEQSRGVPRVINIIADTALVYAYSAQDLVADIETIRNVIRDKLEFGVFGLATDEDGAQPASDDAGPTAFIKPDPVAAKSPPASRRASPAKSSAKSRPVAPTKPAQKPDAQTVKPVEAGDEPRMPAPTRRRRTAPANANMPTPSANVVDALPGPAPVPAVRKAAPAAHSSPSAEKVRPTPQRVSAPAEIATPRTIETLQPSAAAGAAAVVGVVVVGAGAQAEATIQSIGDNYAVIYVAQSKDDDAAEAARRSGADVVQIADRALSPGRARNAGYRQLKKQQPGLDYVQFVEAGVTLDPDWLANAGRFMNRRPEVAAIEGAIEERPTKRSIYSSTPDGDEAGEIQTTGATAFVRAEAFEGAGGFRGDLIVNEAQDLCIRLRRRGSHIWRVDAPMGARDSGVVRFGDWWLRSMRKGFAYAHGAALHGGPPDRLYSAEQARAICWGAVFPFLIALFAGGGAIIAALFAPLMNPLIVFASAIAFGVVIYLVRIVTVAFHRGAGQGSSWAHAFLSTIGCVPEFFGAWRYHFGSTRAKQVNRSAV